MPGQTEIRPFAADDLLAVAALLRSEFGHPPAADLERFLRATLLEDPWADPELPSLVAVQDGAVVGFIARQPRRLELDGAPLRAAICSHLSVAPAHRGSALAMRLARACLRGPQRLTYSDSGGDVVVRMWRLLGGDVDGARACEWMIALRPGRWAVLLAREVLRGGGLGPAVMPVANVPLHVLWRRTRRRALDRDPQVSSQRADGALLAEHLPALEPGARLRPVADAAHLSHTLATLAATGRRIEARMVRRAGRPIGAWVCVAGSGGVAQVLLLAARERESAAVLGDLATTAHGWGAAVLAGRLEPHMRDAVRARGPALGLPRLPLVHTRDDAVRAALAAGASLLPKLETEWWVP
jgi:hypothetical protein